MLIIAYPSRRINERAALLEEFHHGNGGGHALNEDNSLMIVIRVEFLLDTIY